MTFGSLFAGIGGIDLGLERAGMECRWQVEIDPFCQKVLEKHWPEVPKYGDITKLTGEELEPVQLVAAGFPCQDISIGGEGRGIIEGDRSSLFFELIRIVRLLGSPVLLLENVAELLDNGMGEVLGTLAEIGYDCEWDCLPAVAFGAPHQRDRIFIFAYPKCSGLARHIFPGSLCVIPSQTSAKFGNRDIACGPWWAEHSERLRMGDGIPGRVARHWLRVYGNAVVPQIAEWIGRRILEIEAQG